MTCEDVTSEDGAEGKTEVPLTIANLDLSDTYIKVLVTERLRLSDVAFTALDEYSTDDTDNKTDGLAIIVTLELAINAEGVLFEKLLEAAPWDTTEDDSTNTRNAEDTLSCGFIYRKRRAHSHSRFPAQNIATCTNYRC